MLKNVAWGLVSILFFVACGPAKKGLFTDRRTDHQKYADQLKEAGLANTSMANQWFAAAQKSLEQPLTISLPYKEAGYFAAEKPSASGYQFEVRRGDKVSLTVAVVPDTVQHFFGELWKPAPRVSESELIASIDSTRTIVHEVEEDGLFLFRLQPSLLESVEFTLTIVTQPSLAFPVSESGNPRLISFWSDPRDGGKRSHEGVDISAKFRAPAIASADGVVSRVMENRLGGKVVFMRPEGKRYSLYYAHLDSQIVSTGDRVTKGQVLGLVGNTGNAKGTVPHLHFGIYGWGGAIDPLPFIDPRRKDPAPLVASTDRLGQWQRTTTKTRLLPSNNATTNSNAPTLDRGSVVQVNGASGTLAKVILPDGREGFVDHKILTSNPINTAVTDSSARLLDRPLATAPAIATINDNEKLEVLGNFEAFKLVRAGNKLGWIMN